MANTFAQAQLTPMNVGGGEFKVPSLAALGQQIGGLGKQQSGAVPGAAQAPNLQAQPQTYIDPFTGQRMIGTAPGANGQPATTPVGYNWNADQTAVGSGAWRRVADPDFFRPDGGGR
jgi:hypothetical protein